MSTIAGDVLDAVKAALATINGAGSYTLNLSTTGRVIEGLPADFPEVLSAAVVYVDGGDIISTHAPELGRYRRDFTIPILGFTPANADTPVSRKRMALTMFDDICRALETDRSLGGLVIDLILEGGTFSGDGFGGGNLAGVFIELNAHWWVDAQGGV